MADADALCLAKALREPGFSASVITTFNAYLPFYEEVVLRRLVAAGCTHNIVLMDARQCGAALADAATRPRRAGRDYLLAPIACGGAFHPKILLRLGKKRGSLFVGSHNLTLAGFGLNDELSNRFDHDPRSPSSSVAPFRQATELIRRFTSNEPKQIADAITAAFESAPWLTNVHAANESANVLGSHLDGPDLWGQIRALIRGQVRRALIVAPFFDSKLAFLATLLADLRPKELVVAVDPETVELAAGAAKKFRQARFVDVRGRIPSNGRREGVTPYLHAKLIWLEMDAGAIVVSGSANASAPAFLANAASRNNEAVVVRHVDSATALARTLGVAAFFKAPSVSSATWSDVDKRMTKKRAATDSPSAEAKLAIATDQGFTIPITLPVGAQVDVLDQDLLALGHALVTVSGPPAILVADDEVVEGAAFISCGNGEESHWMVVHHPLAIAEHFASKTKTALRKALGSLEEDPSQLEFVLKLSEKVIFDDEGSLEKEGVTQLKPSTPPPSP